jgi:uncharacterized membrane protein YbhN (UPF0104 family)
VSLPEDNSVRPSTDSGVPVLKVVSLLVGLSGVIVALALVAAYLRTEPTALDRLRDTSARAVLSATIALFLVMIANGLILRDLVMHFRVSLPVRSWLGITLIGSLLNLVSPIKGSAAARAFFLKRYHDVSYSSFACVLAVSLLFSLSMSGAVAALAIVSLGVPGGEAGRVALLASLGVAASLPLGLLVAPAFSSFGKYSPDFLMRVAEGWRSIRNDGQLLLRLGAWNTAASLMHAFAFVMAFRIAGVDAHWLVPVASSAFARIGALIAITPAGLGIFEAFGAISASIVGADAAAALLGVIIVRLLSTICSIAGSAAFLPLLGEMWTSGNRFSQ